MYVCVYVTYTGGASGSTEADAGAGVAILYVYFIFIFMYRVHTHTLSLSHTKGQADDFAGVHDRVQEGREPHLRGTRCLFAG